MQSTTSGNKQEPHQCGSLQSICINLIVNILDISKIIYQEYKAFLFNYNNRYTLFTRTLLLPYSAHRAASDY